MIPKLFRKPTAPHAPIAGGGTKKVGSEEPSTIRGDPVAESGWPTGSSASDLTADPLGDAVKLWTRYQRAYQDTPDVSQAAVTVRLLEAARRPAQYARRISSALGEAKNLEQLANVAEQIRIDARGVLLLLDYQTLAAETALAHRSIPSRKREQLAAPIAAAAAEPALRASIETLNVAVGQILDRARAATESLAAAPGPSQAVFRNLTTQLAELRTDLADRSARLELSPDDPSAREAQLRLLYQAAAIGELSVRDAYLAGLSAGPSRAESDARLAPVTVEGVVDPKRAPGVTPADLERLQRRLASGDRAGVYLELYRMTGQEFWLMDAQITSYSGLWGGGALTANSLIKKDNPDLYTFSLDRFSHDIVANMLKLVEQSIEAGDRGRVHSATLLGRGDGEIWERNGLRHCFPGGGLFLEIWRYGSENIMSSLSRGTLYSIKAVLSSGGANGKRPSEFRSHPRYDTHHSGDGRFTTVIDKTTGKVEAFFDRKTKVMGLFGQIDDQPLERSDPRWQQRADLWAFMQANQDSPQPYDPSAREKSGERSLPGRYVEAGLWPAT